VYDIWGMPVRDADPEKKIHVPLLGINSEAFMYWRDNFQVAQTVTQEALEEGQPAWLMTVRGTVHISQSDFCILYPHIASAVLKMTIDPIRAIDLNLDASLDFLSRVMPADIRRNQPFLRTLSDKKLLDLKVLHELPTEHQPNEKWMAVRLRVRHEGLKRITPGTRRRYWERLQSSGEEVWLHMSPECAQLGRCETCGQKEDSNSKGVVENRDDQGDEWENIEEDARLPDRVRLCDNDRTVNNKGCMQ